MTNKVKQRIEQIGRGEVPEGYRKTKAGIMPDAWLSDKIYKAKDVFYSVTNKKHNGQFEVLSATQDRGVVPRSQVDIDIKYSEESVSGYKKVDKGDFVISLRSFQGGIEYSEYEGLVSPAYTVLKNKLPICDGYYKAYFKTNDYINRLNKGTYGIRDGKQVGFEDFGDMVIHYPSLAEQEKIAEILGMQDKLIALKEKRIAEKKQQKKYLMQQLLTGKKRLPGFTSEWKMIKLGECCEIIKGDQLNKNTLKTDGEFYVLNGGITPSGYVDKWNVLENTISISEGGNSCGFVNYNKTKFWSGGHNYTLQNIGECILNLYLYQFLKANENNIMDLRVGSGLPNIQKEALLNFKVFIPNLFEQQGIADILSQADQEIELLQKDLEEEKNKKKALMQLLLTGIVRTEKLKGEII